MKYDSIPLPQINFADVPEAEAETIRKHYFDSSFTLSYYEDTPKNAINELLWENVNRNDRIVILSYLINSLTEKLYNLIPPRSDRERGVQEHQTKPMYTKLLHWLYRKIEDEGIEIPQDFFSEDEHKTATKLISDLSNFLEEQKEKYPNEIDTIDKIKKRIEKTKKFLWLGKEEWLTMILGLMIEFAVKETINPLLPRLLELIKQAFHLHHLLK